jgi:ribosomal protein L37AE/L43A
VKGVKMKPICPDCKSQIILYKRKTNTLYCRRCGWEWVRKLSAWNSLSLKKQKALKNREKNITK